MSWITGKLIVDLNQPTMIWTTSTSSRSGTSVLQRWLTGRYSRLYRYQPGTTWPTSQCTASCAPEHWIQCRCKQDNLIFDLESGKVTVSTPPIECRSFDILLPHLLLPVMDSAVEEKQQLFPTLRLVCRHPNCRQPARPLPLSIGTESGFCSRKLLLTPPRRACVVTICSDGLG